MKHSGRLCGLTAVVAVLPLLVSCDAGAEAAFDAEDGPRVVASFYPLEYVAQQIAGDLAQVQNLTSPGLEPHDLELTLQQSAAVADAELAFYARGFQPAVDAVIEQSDPAHVVEATDVISSAGDDPHFWLDPSHMISVAEAFRAEMTELDSVHASGYREGFESLRRDLVELDQDYRSGLADCEIETVVVSHDAFGYLEKYGLEFVAINGLSPDAEPSPSHIAELQDLARSVGLTTVFSETLASPAMSQTLAEDLGIRTGVLDPIEGLGEGTSQSRDSDQIDYLSLMRKNLDALQEANRCR